MIDPAMLTPAAPSKPKSGLGVLSATPQSAQAFAKEFGAALRTVNRDENKPAVGRENTASPASVARATERTPDNNDRVVTDRQDTPMKGRDTNPSVSVHKPERTQPDNGSSNDVQAQSATTEDADPPTADHVAAQEESSEADQAVDALRSLLTMGAISSADVDAGTMPSTAALGEPVAPDTAVVSEEESLSSGVSSAEPATSPNTDLAVNTASTDGETQSTDGQVQDEPSAPSTDARTSTSSGVDPQADARTTGTQASEAVQPAEPASLAGVLTQTTPAHGQISQALATEATEATVGVGSPSTQTGIADTSAEANTAMPLGAEDVGAQAGPDAGEAPASRTTAEATPLEATDASQAEPGADQGDQPQPQQGQPVQPTSAKADTSTAQPLIGGVQAPGQATSVASSAATSSTQGQQPGQPAPAPTLTPAQQLASAMGALRRRGDGSYMTEITLNPKELGQVRLQVHVAGNTVSMHATALDPATRALLNTGLDDLSQALVDAGLESGHLDVNQGDGQTGDGTDADQPFAGFGAQGVHVIEEEDLTMAAASADYITSTSVNTLA